ncbi:endonuclease VIII [Petroclostridium sp. X23]|uniref:endonuclease VIII n=1 Tax=Petroclostridium sp. X23 TaxID=3045146 RepID=UPI0024AD3EDB|nr:endonuclease VIII [Petroclostridium sp. X23]WHH60802.1 endonuclease VIII [Petroclostridium sp. X23]
MIELPEADSIARQINETLIGKKIMNVVAAQHPHRFAWYYGDPQCYHDLLYDKVIDQAVSYGGLVEIIADDACVLLGEGIHLRYYHEGEKLPVKHQLHIEFDDYSSITASVQMYGGMWAYPRGQYDNKYYMIAKQKPNPLSDVFDEGYFNNMFGQSPKELSLKAFLATEQRIPGLGNGVLQDILFNAKLHPKKKLNTLTDLDIHHLFYAVKTTLAEMTIGGGRDTERDLFGCFGGYRTILSKNTVDRPCIACGDIIKKAAYMGGSIYFCPTCQKL